VRLPTDSDQTENAIPLRNFARIIAEAHGDQASKPSTNGTRSCPGANRKQQAAVMHARSVQRPPAQSTTWSRVKTSNRGWTLKNRPASFAAPANAPEMPAGQAVPKQAIPRVAVATDPSGPPPSPPVLGSGYTVQVTSEHTESGAQSAFQAGRGRGCQATHAEHRPHTKGRKVVQRIKSCRRRLLHRREGTDKRHGAFCNDIPS
jgi:hypothetical protein